MKTEHQTALAKAILEKLQPHAERVISNKHNEFDFLPAALLDAQLQVQALAAKLVELAEHAKAQDQSIRALRIVSERNRWLGYASVAMGVFTIGLLIAIWFLVKR